VESFFLRNSFDAPFPGKNRKMSYVFGDELVVKQGADTIVYRIYSGENNNLILYERGDTMFFGKVSRYRGLYYFSQQLNDTSYRIFAVKLSDSLIYGLNTALEQSFHVDRAIEQGRYPGLVKYFSLEKDIIRLQPDEKELRKLFTEIMDSIRPDTIIPSYKMQQKQQTDSQQQTLPPGFGRNDIIKYYKFYPNPVRLQREEMLFYLLNAYGEVVLEEGFTGRVYVLNMSGYPEGDYTLVLVRLSDGRKETEKIIKIN
jgi:hypothetical protein